MVRRYERRSRRYTAREPALNSSAIGCSILVLRHWRIRDGKRAQPRQKNGRCGIRVLRTRQDLAMRRGMSAVNGAASKIRCLRSSLAMLELRAQKVWQEFCVRRQTLQNQSRETSELSMKP